MTYPKNYTFNKRPMSSVNRNNSSTALNQQKSNSLPQEKSVNLSNQQSENSQIPGKTKGIYLPGVLIDNVNKDFRERRMKGEDVSFAGIVQEILFEYYKGRPEKADGTANTPDQLSEDETDSSLNAEAA